MLITAAMIQINETGQLADLDTYAVIAVFTTGLGAAAGKVKL